MLNEQNVTKNLLKSYSENIGFPVYTAEELQKLYQAFNIDPKSTNRNVFDTGSLSHHTQFEFVKLLKMMNISKNDLLLDAGCGNGAPTRLIAKLYGCKIKAFDLNPNQIKKAIDCDILEGVDNLIKRDVQNVHEIDYQEESFDKVFHNETICHWMNKKKALSGLYKVLKKGGIMGFHDWLKGDNGDLNDAKGDFPNTYASDIWFQNTIEETNKLLEEAGFTTLHYEDTTDKVDIGLRAKLKELHISKAYLNGASEEYFNKIIRYLKIMIETHYAHLRYGRFLCVKN